MSITEKKYNETLKDFRKKKVELNVRGPPKKIFFVFFLFSHFNAPAQAKQFKSLIGHTKKKTKKN